MKKHLFAVAALAIMASLGACREKTMSQKVEDKMEDAGHNIEQAGERGKENVKDATN